MSGSRLAAGDERLDAKSLVENRTTIRQTKNAKN
jgi:hypothetical protein